MTYFSNIFISDSFADGLDVLTATNQSILTSFIPLILIFLVFYFLLIRPQQKKAREHQNTLNQLKNGNNIQTNGGIFGVVRSISSKENTVDLEIANNVVIKILKQSIANVITDKDNNLSQKKVSNKDKKLRIQNPVISK
jgi:preprotein translocase subunit YajC